MGRAIVRDPQVFLFDEPLSNLDAKLRVAMRTEIKELHQRLKTTTVYVTHDQIEAMTMADKIVVMHDGIVEQMGAPLELYDQPGQPVRRRLHRLAGDEFPRRQGEGRTAARPGSRPRTASSCRWRRRRPTSNGRPVVYGIRPEHLDLADDGVEAEVVVVEPTGSETQVVARVGGAGVDRGVPRAPSRSNPGDKIRSAAASRRSCICSTRTAASADRESR